MTTASDVWAESRNLFLNTTTATLLSCSSVQCSCGTRHCSICPPPRSGRNPAGKLLAGAAAPRASRCRFATSPTIHRRAAAPGRRPCPSCRPAWRGQTRPRRGRRSRPDDKAEHDRNTCRCDCSPRRPRHTKSRRGLKMALVCANLCRKGGYTHRLTTHSWSKVVIEPCCHSIRGCSNRGSSQHFRPR